MLLLRWEGDRYSAPLIMTNRVMPAKERMLQACVMRSGNPPVEIASSSHCADTWVRRTRTAAIARSRVRAESWPVRGMCGCLHSFIVRQKSPSIGPGPAVQKPGVDGAFAAAKASRPADSAGTEDSFRESSENQHEDIIADCGTLRLRQLSAETAGTRRKSGKRTPPGFHRGCGCPRNGKMCAIGRTGYWVHRI